MNNRRILLSCAIAVTAVMSISPTSSSASSGTKRFALNHDTTSSKRLPHVSQKTVCVGSGSVALQAGYEVTAISTTSACGPYNQAGYNTETWSTFVNGIVVCVGSGVRSVALSSSIVVTALGSNLGCGALNTWGFNTWKISSFIGGISVCIGAGAPSLSLPAGRTVSAYSYSLGCGSPNGNGRNVAVLWGPPFPPI